MNREVHPTSQPTHVYFARRPSLALFREEKLIKTFQATLLTLMALPDLQQEYIDISAAIFRTERQTDVLISGSSILIATSHLYLGVCVREGGGGERERSRDRRELMKLKKRLRLVFHLPPLPFG